MTNNFDIEFYSIGPVIATITYTPTPTADMTPRERHQDQQDKRHIQKKLNALRSQPAGCLK